VTGGGTNLLTLSTLENRLDLLVLPYRARIPIGVLVIGAGTLRGRPLLYNSLPDPIFPKTLWEGTLGSNRLPSIGGASARRLGAAMLIGHIVKNL
jgi:hypothetical protein